MKLLARIAVPAVLIAACAASPASAAARSAKRTVGSYTPLRVNLHPNRLGKGLTFTLVSGPQHGTLVLPRKQSGRYGYATYTSNRDYVGPDSFTWKVNEGSGDSNVATMSYTVTACPPTPLKQAPGHVAAGGKVRIPVAFTGGGGYKYAVKHSKPRHGTVSLEGEDFRYTAPPGFTGADSFTWHMLQGKTSASAETAPVTCWIVAKRSSGSDWPQWRADEWRSGFTTMPLPEELHLQWRREIPPATRPFAARGDFVYADVDYCRPVQMGKRLFVPVAASDRISAYDTETGGLAWSFYASGALRRPPAALKLPGGEEAVILSSDDGHVYCLNAADGSVCWKFRAAPNGRMAMGFGRLSSAWPILASPVVSGGKVYVTAGYIPSFGLYAYCLDAATGSVLWVNDGRITDMFNTSTFGPLAVSYDGEEIYASVEGASRPWVADSATGKFLGHVGLGYEFSGSGNQRRRDTMSRGECGWYVDGGGAFNVPDPVTITAGDRKISPGSVEALGVHGTVASLLAGDGKLFVTTAEGGIYCFGGKPGKAAVHPLERAPLPAVSDQWTATVKTMLSREDLKQGLALVLGVGSGRLAEELARQSSLMVVAVDPDRGKLQALRARADAAGLSGARISTLEGDPMSFAFAPCQAALITSEDVKSVDLADGGRTVERLYRYTRPFGGEIWLPGSASRDAAISGHVKASGSMPLCEVVRAGTYTCIRRAGLPDEALRIKPPFGLIAFGGEGIPAASSPLAWAWKGKDLYSWLPLTSNMPGRVAAPSDQNKLKGNPTPATLTTSDSIFSAMLNPLFGTVEQFPGLPSSGCDRSCTAIWCRDGDFGLTHGKISSFFDASSHYWGRLFFPEAGGCPGRLFLRNGVLVNTATPVPGSSCGCSAAMQFTTFAIAPMEFEENWVNYQRVRSGNPVEERAIRKVGVNFGAPGDRLVSEDGLLWTHHPYSGRYGRCSYNFASMPEALPLIPVTYSGPVKSVYRHSAQMDRSGKRYRGWVAASSVEGMTGITVPLAQPAVALKTTSAPKVDGNLDDACWNDARKLVFAVNRTVTDRDRKTGLPKPDEHCYAMLRFDDQNLYVAAGVHAEYGPPTSYRPDARKSVSVTLNSRERTVPDVVVTGTDTLYKGKTTAGQESTGLAKDAWQYAGRSTEQAPYTAELALPWKALEAAGLWKDQMIINISVSGGSLTGDKFLTQYTPLCLGEARGAATKPRPYTVRLYFAEMGGVKPGGRVFDVSLQGKPALEKLDVVKEAGGGRRELMKEFKGVGIAETLSIDFKAHAGDAMLSGVEIVGEYAAKDMPSNLPPAAEIAASALSGPAPLEVTFDARKSADPDGQVVQCAWDTGDGRLAKGSLLRHVYAEPGEYEARLRVRDDRGAMATKNVTVRVAPGGPAAFVCQIRAKGGDYATLSAWESAMRSDLTGSARLFRVTARGSYASSDDGKNITFAGGGTGKLRHVNGADIAYVTDCKGSIEPGAVKCASGHAFDVADSGHPVYTIVAECRGDLADDLKAASGWKTGSLHCPVIRAAKGGSGFTVKGDLDLSSIPNLRLTGIAVAPAKTLVLGAHASASHIRAGSLKVHEGTSVADSAAEVFSAGNTGNVVNMPISVYTLNIKGGGRQAKDYQKPVRSNITFYGCAAKTFDPGNQAGVEFVGCTVAPGGEGYGDRRYSEPAIIVE